MSTSVSVIVCNYNCGRFLAEGLKSILAQDVKPLEILVVDDGSTDDSRAQVEPFLGNVEWIPVAHGGQGLALNAALSRCRGDWVAFLESDDVWVPGKLKAVLDCLSHDSALSAVQHSMNQVDAELKPLPTELPPPRRQTLADFLAGRSLLTGLSALTVRRETLSKLLPLPGDLITCVDDYLHPRLLLSGPVMHLAEPLGLRRVHGSNFYAGIRQDPSRLKLYLELSTTLDAHLHSFLKEQGQTLSAENDRKRRMTRLELELFWHRSQGLWRTALDDWMQVVALCGWRPYSLFKSSTLAAALVSPQFYFLLMRVYETQSWLPRLRRMLLP